MDFSSVTKQKTVLYDWLGSHLLGDLDNPE
jgi:hypothetical protein